VVKAPPRPVPFVGLTDLAVSCTAARPQPSLRAPAPAGVPARMVALTWPNIKT
jgi:hypothetical protein